MHLKQQSAMEYLMTYGWAVLIIAIVLIAFFEFGVFNAPVPTIQAGACYVFKSTASVSLAGRCQGAWPNYVAQFNGASSYIGLPSSVFNYITSGATNNYNLTFSVWFYTTSNGIILGQDNGAPPPSTPGGWVPAIYIDSNGLVRASVFWHTNTAYQIVSSAKYNNGRWHNLVDTYNNGIETLYIDGQEIGYQTYSESGYSTTYSYFLGTGYGLSWRSTNSGWFYFGSGISNVQIYNTSLATDEINALYLEGIGGAPIDSTHIVGWWPLNGNAQDYSGNGNNAQVNNIEWSSAWESAYTPP